MAENIPYKVLITNPSVLPIVMEILEHECDLVICSSETPTKVELLQKVAGVDAILWAGNDRLNSEICEAAGPSLRVVSTITAGYDNVDVEELKKRSILLGYTPTVADSSVAELAIGLMLAAARRFYEGRKKIDTSTWETNRFDWMLGQNIHNKIVGFFGFGRVGQAIAKRLMAFDIQEIIYTTRKSIEESKERAFRARKVSFDHLCERSDILFVAAPLSDETRNIFDYTSFLKMKKTSIFVNVARGGIVNQTALVAALKTNQIFAAGIDVVVTEPIASGDPILTSPNLIITPNLASATAQTRHEMSVMAAQNILKGLRGEGLVSSVY